MRVAMVGNFALTGNQTMAARALPLARVLVSRGHVVRMALPVRTGDDRPGVENSGGVEIHQVGHGILPRLLGHVWQILWMAHLCYWWRPSVVYCFKPIAHSGAVLALFLALRRLGLYHGQVVLDADDWEGDGGWNEKQPFPGWLKRLISKQERWSLGRPDALTVASLELVKLATKAGAGRVFYLPNCLEEELGPPEPGSVSALRDRLSLGPAPLVLIYTRFVEYHMDRLLCTFEAILRISPEAIFVVAGSGLRGEERDLQREVVRRGLEEKVKILGWVKRGETPDLFASADLALYLLDDNLLNRTKCPMKMAELASAGVPIVADRVGQASEYVREGETGILVTPEAAEEMAGAAVSLLGDPERRFHMSQAARDLASRRMLWVAWLPVLEKALGIPL